MNEDFIVKNKYILFGSLIIILIITFYPLFFTGIGCADDLQCYLIARWGNYMSSASGMARIAGRFYYYIVKPLNSLPYSYDNMFVIKLYQILPLIFCFILFARVLYVMTKSRELSLLYFLLFLVIAQISGYTSLFVTYPFYYTFSFILLLISFLLMLNFLTYKKKSSLSLSVILFAIGLLFYESYLLFLIIIALTIFYYNRYENKTFAGNLKRSFIHFSPFLGVALLYLAVYFIFRYYHPSHYDGTSFKTSDFRFSSFFQVLWNLSYSSFPLAVFQSSRPFFTEKSDLITGYSPVVLKIILNARLEWLIKGGLVALCGYFILVRMPKTGIKPLIMATIVSILLVFTPHIPLALTPKYTFYVSHGMIGYVTTFFSLFGVVLLLTFLLGYLINLLGINRFIRGALAVIMVFGLFICSILTDFSNYTIARDIRSANLRFFAMDELMKTEMFSSLPAGSKIYAKDMYDNISVNARNLTEQSFNWGQYIDAKTRINHLVFREEKEFLESARDTSTPSYYLTMKQAAKSEEIFLAFAELGFPARQDTLINTFADKVWVLHYSPYKIFTVSFKCKEAIPAEGLPVGINHIRDTIQPGQTIQLTIYNTRAFQAATVFSIKAGAIDLKSIMISDLVDPRNRVFYL